MLLDFETRTPAGSSRNSSKLIAAGIRDFEQAFRTLLNENGITWHCLAKMGALNLIEQKKVEAETEMVPVGLIAAFQA